MIRVLRYLTLSGLLLPFAHAQTGTLDQVSPFPTGSSSASFNTVSSLVWQMQVRAGVAGALEGVTLTVSGPAGGTLDVRIRVGDGWNTSPPAFTGVLVKPTAANFEEVFVDTTSAGIQVPVGSTFVIELQGSDGAVGANGSYVAGAPLYPEPLFLGGPGCFADCGWRIAFKTWVVDPSVAAFCFGDGTSATACPCGNTGATGRGCENSASTGGALLTPTGTTSPDALVLTSSGEFATSTSILLQGDVAITNGLLFGDGVRCVGGTLKRIGVESAVGGVATFPGPGDPSITAQSALLGDPIAPGSTRWYQVYYRDPILSFCPAPPGNSWNVSGGVRVVWP